MYTSFLNLQFISFYKRNAFQQLQKTNFSKKIKIFLKRFYLQSHYFFVCQVDKTHNISYCPKNNKKLLNIISIYPNRIFRLL